MAFLLQNIDGIAQNASKKNIITILPQADSIQWCGWEKKIDRSNLNEDQYSLFYVPFKITHLLHSSTKTGHLNAIRRISLAMFA